MITTNTKNNIVSETSCPPLSEKDIFNLRGQPACKSKLLKNEEWVYYSLPENTKEHYFFRNGRLVRWMETKDMKPR